MKKPKKKRPPQTTIRQRLPARLVPNADRVAKHASSVRFMVGAFAILAGGAAALPFLAPAVPVKYLAAYCGVIFLCVTGAIVARFWAQKNMGIDLDAD